MLVAGAVPGGDPTKKRWTKAGVEGGWTVQLDLSGGHKLLSESAILTVLIRSPTKS